MSPIPATGNPLSLAEASGVALFALAAALPKGEAPEWVVLFPTLGKVETRDGRHFEVDAATLLQAFRADGLELPVDVNHATDLAAFGGGRSNAVGWVTELREQGGRLEGRVDWLDEGRSLLAARQYRYVSPSFYRDDLNRATRLKAVALVTAPALGRMPALAGAAPANPPPEVRMKSVATALGLPDTADEAALLGAVNTLKSTTVPKTVHDQALEQLRAASTELGDLKKAARAEKVKVLLDGALSAKKIVPAQRPAYEGLCATDEGLTQVEQLFAATAPQLAGSGLDVRPQPGAGQVPTDDPILLAARAQKLQDERRAAGAPITFAEAMTLATRPTA